MITCLLAVSVLGGKSQAQDLLSNVYGRDYQLLNGKWGAIVDLYDQGERMQVYKNRKPQDNKQFYEYSFDGGLVLNVPADFNSQMPELKFYEGTVWYGRSFDTPKTDGKRLFLYFGAVSYRSKIYLNGEKIASHEGGFTPFQVEITDKVKQKDNFLVVKVNNTRTTDAIPAMSFDWWNYGGITRDVMLVSVPQSYIKDHFIQLDKVQSNLIRAKVTLSEAKPGINVQVAIPELGIRQNMTTDANGIAQATIKTKKRLAHYPQNEYTVRLAERMGFLLWEEIPIWQGIDFKNTATREKAGRMIKEMVMRDKNRCSVAFWGIANETATSAPRNEFLKHMKQCCLDIDSTRLITAAFDLVRFNRESRDFEMNDSIINILDMVAINKYMGWYHDWPLAPDQAVWNVAPGKPLFISEFGGEALYGKHGDAEVKSSWSEDYQAQLYKDNLEMFKHIPNLRGTSPWILLDFRSPFRFHPHQGGEWNRKGLVSDQGQRKKAWYIMRDYYNQKKTEQ